MIGELDLERQGIGQWCQGGEAWRRMRPLHYVSNVILEWKTIHVLYYCGPQKRDGKFLTVAKLCQAYSRDK